MKYREANWGARASEHSKQRLHQADMDGQRRAQCKQDNFIETVKLLWGPAVINLISLHYPYLYCLAVWLWGDCCKCVCWQVDFYLTWNTKSNFWCLQTIQDNAWAEKLWVLCFSCWRNQIRFYTRADANFPMKFKQFNNNPNKNTWHMPP